jgi:alpha-L-rhamnosidase
MSLVHDPPVGLRVVNLRCEYAVDPPAVSVADPCLSWEIQCADPSRRGIRQTGYRIIVATRAETLAQGTSDVWDTGRVASDRSLGIPYEGRRLEGRQLCFWKVMVWDQDGKPSDWSAPASWTMTLLRAEDWSAKWIGAPEAEPAAPYLRTEWVVSGEPVRATAQFVGLGYGELSLNGRRVGDHVLDPAFTDYTRRVLFSTYDVTDCVVQGRNAAGILLGNGWFRLPTPDLWGFHKASWRGPPRALLQLEIALADGSRETCVTDETWRWALSPIVSNPGRRGHRCPRGKAGMGHDHVR